MATGGTTGVDDFSAATSAHALAESTGANALSATDAKLDFHEIEVQLGGVMSVIKRRHPDSNRGMMVLQTIALAPWLCRRVQRSFKIRWTCQVEARASSRKISTMMGSNKVLRLFSSA